MGIIPLTNPPAVCIAPTILVKTETPRIVLIYLPRNTLDDSPSDGAIDKIVIDLVDDTVVEIVELVSGGVISEPVDSVIMLGYPILDRVDHGCGNDARSGRTFHGQVGFLAHGTETEPS